MYASGDVEVSRLRVEDSHTIWRYNFALNRSARCLRNCRANFWSPLLKTSSRIWHDVEWTIRGAKARECCECWRTSLSSSWRQALIFSTTWDLTFSWSGMTYSYWWNRFNQVSLVTRLAGLTMGVSWSPYSSHSFTMRWNFPVHLIQIIVFLR